MFSVVTRWMRIVGIGISLLTCCNCASETALSVTPSTLWYGDDGDWSAISIRVGSPPQWLDVMVSTVSSETWVVGSGGCSASDSTCSTSRGKLFNQTKSTTWQDMGFFELGADSQLGNTGYADYGLDDLTFGTTGVILPSAIIGAFNGSGEINTTQYLLGLFGLGVVQGNFTTHTPLSAISALVEAEGVIASHSYGYTAGAKYQQKGVPNSLTLGGYDANRFVPHNITFNLSPSQEPQVYISSISVTSSETGNNWTNAVQLLEASDRVSAIIDSSTPYLWFPEAVCDRFASSFGLSYDDTLNLYTFDTNATKHDVLSNAQLAFTFSFTDTASTTDIVNITLPYEAFDLQLTYPAIPSTAYDATNSTKYYFPLRQASSEAQYTIGRSFLQEAYLITDYERNTFSLHQAIQTADAITNTSIVPIPRPSNSTFSGPPKTTKKSSNKLPKGAIIGIVIGAVVIAILIGFLALYFLYLKPQNQRNNNKATPASESESKSTSSSPPTPTTPISRFLSIFHRNRPSLSPISDPDPETAEATGSTTYPTEISADATHARFELAAPLGPAELDSESGTLDGVTETGTGDSNGLSAYERARRKIERQLTEGSRARMREQDERYTLSEEKMDPPVAVWRPGDMMAPESPVSPLPPGTGTETMSDLVSPMEPPTPGSTFPFFSSGAGTEPVSPDLASAPTSPLTPNTPSRPPPPVYSSRIRRERPVVEPRNVVYVGRLPHNVRLPTLIPRIIGPDGRTVRGLDGSLEEAGEGTNSSLGSGYTEAETRALGLDGSEGGASPVVSTGSGSGNSNISPLTSTASGSGFGSGSGSGSAGTGAVSPVASSTQSGSGNGSISMMRRVTLSDTSHSARGDENNFGGLGGDLVHVPQVAERRFSWEEERIKEDEGGESENKSS